VVADIGMTHAPVHFFSARRRWAGGTPTFNYKNGMPINPKKKSLFSHLQAKHKF
jgi:hypothetical protein